MGIDVHWKSPHGGTALHSSAIAGQPVQVDLLCRAGLDVNAADRDDLTPLWDLIARWPRNGDVCSYEATYRRLVANGADVNCVNYAEHSPLYVAAKAEAVDVCRLLLADGANANHVARHAQGFTAVLHEAVRKQNLELCRLLVSHGADPSYIPKDLREEGRLTPFHSAVMYGATDIVRFFVEECGQRPDELVQRCGPLTELAEEGSSTRQYLLSRLSQSAVDGALAARASDDQLPLRRARGFSPL
jgi:ankyrin repeat protein